MNKLPGWGRRLAYLLVALLWLLLMSFPVFAVLLAVNGEVVIGSDPQQQTRFFLIQEANAEGISVERNRPVAQQRGVQYVETTLTYFMWVGDGQNGRFCQQFDVDSGAFLGAEPGRCAAVLPP